MLIVSTKGCTASASSTGFSTASSRKQRELAERVNRSRALLMHCDGHEALRFAQLYFSDVDRGNAFDEA